MAHQLRPWEYGWPWGTINIHEWPWGWSGAMENWGQGHEGPWEGMGDHGEP